MERNDENNGALDALWYMIQTKIDDDIKDKNNRAESNREFIVYTFNKLAEGQLYYYPEFRECQYVACKIDGDFPPFYGLYMISERCGNEKYPIYVGYTSTRFDTRLANHDVIIWYRNKMRFGQLEFDFIPTFNPSHAKLLESVFLGAFDFCRNKVENVQQREPDYNPRVVNPVQISKKYFDAAYTLMVQEISRLRDYYERNF